jgi:hypothetical protein
MSTTNQAHSRKPIGSKDVELADQYRPIGSAAILAALACKMKQAAVKTEPGARAPRAA